MLIVAMDDPEVQAYADGRLTHGAAAEGAVGVICRYLKQNPGASCSPLHPQLFRRLGDLLRAGLPLSEADLALAPIAFLRVLRLARASDQTALQKQIGADREQITYVHPPSIRYPSTRRWFVRPGNPDQWGLDKCQFEAVWPQLDPSPDPLLKPIAMIDQGTAEGHPELPPGLIEYVPPPGGNGMISPHAGWVAAVIAAVRDGTNGEMLRGCCSSSLRLYNIWRASGGFDACAYYRALLNVAEDELPVLNLSFEGSEDLTECRHIRTCWARDVVVVAAMGLPFKPVVYPADQDEVIAVGGTSPGDKPSSSSRTGSRMWVTAPADGILTIKDPLKYDVQTGTSFSAAFVSAAVWVARRNNKCLKAPEIRQVLTNAVAPTTRPCGGQPSNTMGYGRLDMIELEKALAARPCP